MFGYGLFTVGGLLAACTLALSPARPTAWGKEPAPSTGTVRIGVVSSIFRDVPEPMAQQLLRPMKSLIEFQTGLQGEVFPAGDAIQLGGKLASEKLQLGVFNGFEFAWARLKFPRLQPLVIAVNKSRQARAYLVVRKDCKASALADLEGKTLALPRFTREYTRLFLERACQEKGKDLQEHFGKVTIPPDIEDALDNVVDGQADATAVDSVALENFQQRKPGRLAKLRVLQESEPFPAAVVAYCPGGIDETRLQRFHDGMIGASQTDRGKRMLSMCRMTGFEEVPADYSERLDAIAKAYPAPGESK
jgi:ABC-type phosphate/phosphonate transport system substrate-binding protein